MQSAAEHYRLFLDSFRDDAGELPASVEPEMEQHYLGGLFSMARMLQGLPHTGTLATRTAAVAPGTPQLARCGFVPVGGCGDCLESEQHVALGLCAVLQ